MAIPDWQLPEGVDRGLWDYLHSDEMVRGYDAQIATSPLARADVAFCEHAYPTPGRLLDLGCGTGRLCHHFAAKGYECVGVDLSEEMLRLASENLQAHKSPGMAIPGLTFIHANLVDLSSFPESSFDYAACLFSTLGMIHGRVNRAKVLANTYRLLRPGGRFVLHIHNRFFRGLGRGYVLRQFWRTLWCQPDAGDITMPQNYGGAPLTLHHFTRREAELMLREAGFVMREILAIGVDGLRVGWPQSLRGYGWLILTEKAQ